MTDIIKKNRGLALSGGGSKGLAHVGALKFFEENDISFDSIAGTSAGAIVGGLYACGLKSDDILRFFTTTKMFATHHLTFSTKGFIKTDTLRSEFEKFIGTPKIEDLDVELKIIASDLISGKIKVFEKGDLIDAILASSAYPGVFIPMEIDNNIYSDGGLVNDFPIDLIHNTVNVSVGISLSTVKTIERSEIGNMFDIMSRSFEIIRRHNRFTKSKMADIYLTPLEDDHLGTFDTSEDILVSTYTEGYNYTKDFFQNDPSYLEKLQG